MAGLRLRAGFGNFLLPDRDLPWDAPNIGSPGGYIDFTLRGDADSGMLINNSGLGPSSRLFGSLVTFGATSDGPYGTGVASTDYWDNAPVVILGGMQYPGAGGIGGGTAVSGVRVVCSIGAITGNTIAFTLTPDIPAGATMYGLSPSLFVKAWAADGSPGDTFDTAKLDPAPMSGTLTVPGFDGVGSLTFGSRPGGVAAAWFAGVGGGTLAQSFRVAQTVRTAGLRLATVAVDNPQAMHGWLGTNPDGTDPLFATPVFVPEAGPIQIEIPTPLTLNAGTDYYVGVAGLGSGAIAIDHGGTPAGPAYAAASTPGLFVNGESRQGVDYVLRVEVAGATDARTEAVIYAAINGNNETS